MTIQQGERIVVGTPARQRWRLAVIGIVMTGLSAALAVATLAAAGFVRWEDVHRVSEQPFAGRIFVTVTVADRAAFRRRRQAWRRPFLRINQHLEPVPRPRKDPTALRRPGSLRTCTSTCGFSCRSTRPSKPSRCCPAVRTAGRRSNDAVLSSCSHIGPVGRERSRPTGTTQLHNAWSARRAWDSNPR
jgi:hypothetical protein